MTFIGSATSTGGGANDFSFTNIPQTFSHLQLRLFLRESTNGAQGGVSVAFNQVFNSYIRHRLIGNGSSATSDASASNQSAVALDFIPGNTATASVFGVAILDILDYTSTVKNKTVRVLNGYDANGAGSVSLTSTLWYPTSIAAISRIDCYPYQGPFAVGSRADLYGIGVSEQTGA